MNRCKFLVALLLLGCGGGDDDDFDLPEFIEVAGVWEGSATFTNNCENPACSYQGTMNPASIIMNISQTFNLLEGTITLNLPQGSSLIEGAPCGPLTGTIGIQRAQSSIDGTQVKITQDDFFGVWNLQIAGTSGPQSTMQGTLTNEAPGCTGLQSDNVSLVRMN